MKKTDEKLQSHRRFILRKMRELSIEEGTDFINKDIKLTEQMLTAQTEKQVEDQGRNFHCWDHRRLLLQLSGKFYLFDHTIILFNNHFDTHQGFSSCLYAFSPQGLKSVETSERLIRLRSRIIPYHSTYQKFNVKFFGVALSLAVAETTRFSRC